MPDTVNGSLDFISNFIRWFSAPYKTMFAVWVILAFTLRGSLHTLIEIAFWFCTAFLALCALEWIGRRILIWHYLQNLPEDERRVIVSFMASHRRTANLIAGAGAALAMVDLGILEETKIGNPNHYAVERGDCFYTLKPWIFRFLENHPDLYRY
jgi:hypothetical protein